MAEFSTVNGHTQIIIPLLISPFSHQASPTITGNLFSDEAGAVLYGHYKMEYLLPHGDKLRLIANHDQKTVQVLLFTHQSELIKLLPGERPSSLIADMINKIHRYHIRSESYAHPLTKEQQKKRQIANHCIKQLEGLLKQERKLTISDHSGQERLRRAAIHLIEQARDQNRLQANHPLISEGALGDCLYFARQAAQHYVFNRAYTVSRHDQMDFSKTKKASTPQPCLVWDSELHLGHNSDDLDDALRVICDYYQLTQARSLNNVPANRLAKLALFFQKMWHDGHGWIHYLAAGANPQHQTTTIKRLDGINITKIIPYYKLQGLTQQGYTNLNALISDLTQSTKPALYANTLKEAQKKLGALGHGHWVLIANSQTILFRHENKLLRIAYFNENKQFYPLPSGEDLYTLAQISKRHLYLPERAKLRLKAFLSRIPGFFINFYHRMYQFIRHDLHEEFMNHVHAGHRYKTTSTPHKSPANPPSPKRDHFVQALERHGLLKNGQTVEQFILEQINKSPYVIAQASHRPSPPAYENPLHRLVGIFRHVASLFVDTSERDPLLGTLASATYLYGGSAVLAPELLKGILTKLHLNGLIAGIEPTQKLAHLLNHGLTSEAISTSVLYWQGVVVGGNLDKFFVEAISLLKDDPAEIAIIAALALSLGYGLTQVIPGLANEMGDFPYMNYAALGAKSGAAVYDTIMHPGEDWFLGTCKWFGKKSVLLSKLFIAPFVEWHHYGFHHGLINGWKKSAILSLQLGKQLTSASLDLLLITLTIPLLELSALLLHVPFRGVTGLITKTLATLGNITALGEFLLAFSSRPPLSNVLAGFKPSPLYGFYSPFGHFSEHRVLNGLLNCMRLLILPPIQLLKNLLILPLLDSASLVVRLGVMLINPLSRVLAYTLGTVLCIVGKPWDHSLGFLFSTCAHGLSLAFNVIDNIAGAIKQNLLSSLTITRNYLYQWAFAKEDKQVHAAPLGDKDYYSARRYELFPHAKNGCLLKMLLEEPEPQENKMGIPVYSKLFFTASKKEASTVVETNERLSEVGMSVS